MIYEFVDVFRNIKIGDKIKIKASYIPPCKNGLVPISSDFVQYIRLVMNCFTIKDIQEIDDDNAIIRVNEVGGILEYLQIQVYNSRKRIINSTEV